MDVRDRPARPRNRELRRSNVARRAVRLLHAIDGLALAIEDDLDSTRDDQYALTVQSLVAHRLAEAAHDAACDPYGAVVLAEDLLRLATGHAVLVEAGLRVLRDPPLRSRVQQASRLVAA